jgi:hypothetical protein
MGRRSSRVRDLYGLPFSLNPPSTFKYPRHHLIIWINRLIATNNHGTCFALSLIELYFMPGTTHEVDQT